MQIYSVAPQLRMHLLLVVVLLCSSLASPVLGLSADRVVVALKPDKNPDAMLAERKALSETLSKRLGKPVDVIVPLSSAVITEGLANGSIDLAFVSATDMVKIRDSKSGSLLLAAQENGKTGYASYWVTLSDKPYRNVEELRGRPIAFSSKSSTSGFLIPLLDLRTRGLVRDGDAPEVFFGEGNVWYGTGYVSAIERVLSGEAEAAAVSDYVLNKDKHLTPEQKARLRKLQEQGPVPTHVLAISSHLSESDRLALRGAILELKGAAGSALPVEFVEVDPAVHLKPVDEALMLTGVQPRS